MQDSGCHSLRAVRRGTTAACVLMSGLPELPETPPNSWQCVLLAETVFSYAADPRAKVGNASSASSASHVVRRRS